jgi:colanic acid/amylovoran biosynthesis glycosyltransferase
MSKPVVAHFIQDYLKPTTNWIYGQIVANEAFEPLVLTKQLMNLDLFKVKKIVSIDQLHPVEKLLNNASYRVRHYHPLFLKTCRENSAALIHAHFGHIGYKALGLKRKLGIPLVTTFYGYDVSALGRIPSYQRRFRELFRDGDLFLAEGPHLGRCLEALGCPPEKIRVFHLGVHVDQYPCFARPEKETVQVLFAATLTDKKGWSDALRSFQIAHLQFPNLRLRLIGAGEDEEKVSVVIKELGLADVVNRSGYVTHEVLLQEMLRADIFLQPSRTAANGNTEGGAPVTLIDAQATGLSICATEHADIPEVSPHRISALLSAEKDVSALARHLLELAQSPNLRRELGQAGRLRVEADYNWKTQGPRQAQLYRDLLN